MPRLAAIPLLLAFACTAACSSVYYSTMEKFGVEKRDILVKRVDQARDSQQDAKEQFANALEQFRSVVAFNGGDLEKKSNQLQSQLDKSEARAADVHKRVDAVDDVAADLFREWEGELAQYSSPALRRQSETELRATRQRADQLIAAMRRAEDKIEPVLKPLREQVLFLKHSLNAQAISAIQGELTGVQADVDALVKELNAAIAEADSFIQAMNK